MNAASASVVRRPTTPLSSVGNAYVVRRRPTPCLTINGSYTFSASVEEHCHVTRRRWALTFVSDRVTYKTCRLVLLEPFSFYQFSLLTEYDKFILYWISLGYNFLFHLLFDCVLVKYKLFVKPTLRVNLFRSPKSPNTCTTDNSCCSPSSFLFFCSSKNKIIIEIKNVVI